MSYNQPRPSDNQQYRRTGRSAGYQQQQQQQQPHRSSAAGYGRGAGAGAGPAPASSATVDPSNRRYSNRFRLDFRETSFNLLCVCC